MLALIVPFTKIVVSNISLPRVLALFLPFSFSILMYPRERADARTFGNSRRPRTYYSSPSDTRRRPLFGNSRRPLWISTQGVSTRPFLSKTRRRPLFGNSRRPFFIERVLPSGTRRRPLFGNSRRPRTYYSSPSGTRRRPRNRELATPAYPLLLSAILISFFRTKFKFVLKSKNLFAIFTEFFLEQS